MGHQHLPWKWLKVAFETGTLERDGLASILDHLAEVCPECRQQLAAIASASPSPQSYKEAFAGKLTDLRKTAHELDSFLAKSKKDLKTLLKLSPERRQTTIDRSRSHYRSPFLVDLLLSECKRRVTTDPMQALELAECAHAVSLRIPHTLFRETWAITSTARATAHRGNALRAAGQFNQGARLIHLGREMMEQQGAADPYIEAEIYSLLASASKDLRAFDDALRYMDHVIETYAQIEDDPCIGRALVQKSTIYRDSGDIAQALATAEEALTRLDHTQDESIYLMATYNRADYLVELGRFSEARDLIIANDNFPPGSTSLLREQWLLGRIAYGLGQLASAESTFLDVRERFTRAELPYDAALAGLDLALVYIDLGKSAELREIAEAMLPIFHAQEVERETIAALMLFHEATRQEVVTRSMVEELASHMQRASRRPRQPERPS